MIQIASNLSETLKTSRAEADCEANHMIDEFIDKLTESIEDARTGRSFPTEISAASRDDLIGLSNDGWRFDWIQQLSDVRSSSSKRRNSVARFTG